MKWTKFLCMMMFGVVGAIDFGKYTGQWFQAGANPFSFYVTENGGTCIKAEYERLDDHTISIVNTELVKGTPKSIKAIGTATSPNRLTVKFDGVPVNGSYVIAEVGPVYNNQYQYSIVTDDQKLSLFILVRNISVYKTELKIG